MSALIALVLLLGALGAGGWALYRAEQALYVPLESPPRPPAPATTPPPVAQSAAGVTATVPPPPAPAAVAAEPPMSGDRWMEATLDALLQQHPDLQLDAEERARLKEIYVYCQHVRTTFEAEVAEVWAINGTHARIRIPPYPQAGARLEQLWVEEVSAELGDRRFDEIDARLGESLEVAFKGFGTSVQLLDVELRRDPVEGLLYRIVARIDHVDPPDAASGGASIGLLTTTTQYSLPAATVATGEWRPLARHFPRLPDA